MRFVRSRWARSARWLAAAGLFLGACGHPASGSRGEGAHVEPSTTTAARGARAIPTSSSTTTTTSALITCDEEVDAVLNTWSVARRAAQLVVAPVEEDDVAAAEPLVAEGVGGLILFGSQAPPNLAVALGTAEQASLDGLAPLVMTDEEGGGIQRLSNLVGFIPWPRTMAESLTPAQVQSLAEQLGQRLRALGVGMDLGPVLDLSDSPGPDARYPDGPRSFSLQPDLAANYGLAFAHGLQAGGVIPVVKHFPGLGQATYNTDDGPAEVPPLAQLETGALKPFEAAIGAGLPAIMVSNASIPGLSGGLPSSLSAAAVTGLLRDRLDFKGLIITDSLSAEAISDAGYSIAAGAALAVEAGADMVVFGPGGGVETANEMIAAITGAVASGQLDQTQLDRAVQQVLTLKGIQLCRAGPQQAITNMP